MILSTKWLLYAFESKISILDHAKYCRNPAFACLLHLKMHYNRIVARVFAVFAKFFDDTILDDQKPEFYVSRKYTICYMFSTKEIKIRI